MPPAVSSEMSILEQVDASQTDAARLDAMYLAAEQFGTILPEYMLLLQKQDDDLVDPLTPIDLLPMDQLELFFLALRGGNMRAAAARAAGILPRQISMLKAELRKPLPSQPHQRVAAIERRRQIQEFFIEVARAEAQMENTLVNTVYGAATREKEPDVKAAQWLLERRFKDSWAPNKTVVHAGAGGDAGPRSQTTINQNILVDNRKLVGKMSDDALAAVEQAMRQAADAPRTLGGTHRIPGNVLTVSAEGGPNSG